MTRKFSVVLFFIILTSCSKFEFVHDKSLKTNPLINNTSIYVGGDNIPILKTKLKENLGVPNNLNFQLSVSSKEETINIVKESNMTASVIQIKQSLVYELKLIEKNCIIVKKEISNSRKFNSKSEGYNFGSDLSKKEIIESLIEENLRQYISYIATNYIVLEC